MLFMMFAFQMQGSQPVFVPLFGTHTGVAQPQGAAAVVAGTARPRVRARRGQATDPHSIAERVRTAQVIAFCDKYL